MTAKNPDAPLMCPPGMKRNHFGCRLRDDLWQKLLDECKRLNCSQVVYLESLLLKSFEMDLIKPHDVFWYVSEERRFYITHIESVQVREPEIRGKRKKS